MTPNQVLTRQTVIDFCNKSAILVIAEEAYI